MQQLAALKQMKGGEDGGMLDEMMGMGGEANQFAGLSKTQLSRYANQLKRSGQPVPSDLREALRGATGVGNHGQGTAEDRAAALARKQDRRKKNKQAKQARKKGRKR